MKAGAELSTPVVIKPHIQNWAVNSQSHLLQQGVHTTNNVVTNRSIILNATIEKTFAVTPSTQYAFSMDDITTYSPPTSPGGGISLLIVNYDYTFRVYKGSSTTAFYTTQFNLANATRVFNFATDSTTNQIRIEISRGIAMTQGQAKYVDNLKLRKFTGNTSVYQTNYSNMSITANALDGWIPDNWSTTSATVDQAAGQYRLVAIGSGATAKVQREFTAMPNQEHRFQYNLSLLNAGSTTVRVEQKVNGVYQYLATQQTQTTSGTYELSFVPSYTDIRISFSVTSRYALNNLYLDRDHVDTLVATYVMGRGYRYGFQAQEKDDEVKGAGNSVNYRYRMHDPRLGRFFAVDPLTPKYPHNSPYVFSENCVIAFVELEGLEKYYAADGSFIGQVGTSTEIRVFTDKNTKEGTKWDKWAIHSASVGRGEAAAYNSKKALNMSVSFSNNLFNSVKNKKIVGAIAEGMQSNTFKNLINNKSNSATFSSTTSGTYTDGKGNMNIDNDGDNNSKILGMTWELTNSSNKDKLNKHRADLDQSEESYVRGIFKIEAEAFVNRALVAEELNVNDPMTQLFKSDIQSYQGGSMTQDDLLSKIADWGYKNATTKDTKGQTVILREEYGKQYRDAKKAQKKK